MLFTEWLVLIVMGALAISFYGALFRDWLDEQRHRRELQRFRAEHPHPLLYLTEERKDQNG
jgi:hypothetical protein